MRENNRVSQKVVQKYKIEMSRVKVSNMHTRQGVTVYEIYGYDKMGYFQKKIKRYKDFVSLHEMLVSNY